MVPIRSAVDLVLQDRRRVFFCAALGVLLLSCLFTLYASVDGVFGEFLVNPFEAASLLLGPAVLLVGLFACGLAVLLWSCLRIYVVRGLLQYNGWFLNPKNPLNKIWYFMIVVLLGKKNRGSGYYQIFLPSLPVPSLKKTCQKYLRSVKPILSDEEYKRTEQIVNDFQKKEGKTLQKYLTIKSWTNRNWISDWWDEYIYLRQRTPIPFNSNYFSLGTRRPTTPHQLDRAAMLIHLGTKFATEYDAGRIPNMMALNLVPFCMHSMKFNCASCRIPGREVDTFEFADFKTVTHSVVIRRGKMYSIQVLTKDNRIFPPSLLKKQLERVMEMAGDEDDETGVAAFTALPREEWAEIRERLIKDPTNKETLDAISTGFNFVSLETESPPVEDLTARGRDIFHGNLYNRWFDKSVCVPVYPNGLTASNAEHSHLDATICSQTWEYMLQREEYDDEGHIVEHGFNLEDYPKNLQPKELKWNVDDLKDELAKAKENLRNMVSDSDLHIISPAYGKDVPKKCRLSPDGWFQMALQLTYYRIYHKLVLTYESATTRLYYKGRTETIRPVSMQSKAFVESMDDPQVSVEKKKALLKEAIKYQEQYKFEAMRGMGVDRHLFGLYIVAKWLKMDPMPEIFEDEAFQLKFTLSTSQTPTQCIKEKDYDDEKRTIVGGFGTVTDNGYGVSYIISGEETVYFSIHSKNSCTETSSERFGEELKKSFEDMREIFS
ncbi:PREDICTED: carnitine O-palmitoyltransferase 1, liver isoform-like isoform X2 [Amphimedon queenslandica]|uniref:Choline/carnitine acyltransferase domain-containing protein n=1 Tax=Amphimedon queenslandica TaxID=400682 RepID=A0AAN0ICD7_AMPQE|nr:PREDICTED: carnitine O-palmitoyltransferase 1, liver isoform-like isoform X2 [Amphimedon queenslandica]|eukprot:XP_003384970.2 PREDICTED: carnitine O-palmitoyltransferase 1, liver isoform-like isoform X2 [Amphimedon queenslandica]